MASSDNTDSLWIIASLENLVLSQFKPAKKTVSSRTQVVTNLGSWIFASS